MIHPLRIYTDTSVIGGCFDEEFAEHSNRLLEGVRGGHFQLLISDVVTRELVAAPARVRQTLEALDPGRVEFLTIGQSTVDLVDAYLDADVVGPRWIDDATHVAAASLAKADAIVSWNFKHIVRLDRIKGYNRVNRLHGLPPLTILSPMEVRYGDED